MHHLHKVAHSPGRSTETKGSGSLGSCGSCHVSQRSFLDLWDGQHTGPACRAACRLPLACKQHGLHAAQLVALCATLLTRLPCCCVWVLYWRLQDNRKDNRRHREYHSHLTLDTTSEAPFHVPALSAVVAAQLLTLPRTAGLPTVWKKLRAPCMHPPLSVLPACTWCCPADTRFSLQWQGGRDNKFLKFVLLKENMDTQVSTG